MVAKPMRDCSDTADGGTVGGDPRRRDREGMRRALRLAELLSARLLDDLDAEVASASGGRQRLLRAAWAGQAEECDARELADLLAPVAAWRNVELDLAGVSPSGRFAANASRLVLNLVLLGAESLPGGGTISLSGAPQEAVVLGLDGPRAAWPPGLAAGFADEEAAWAMLGPGASMQAVVTLLLARSGGFRLSFLMAVGPRDPVPPLLLDLLPRNRI